MYPAYDLRRKIFILTLLRVSTRISADVTKPLEDRKFDGIFTITAELSPLASPAFEIGRCVELHYHRSLRILTLRG